MGRTWQRRPKRRGAPHALRKHTIFRLRLCCRTQSREPHARECQRHPITCGDKVAFDSRGDARSHAITMAGRTDLWWRAYSCPWCGLFHLTTQVE